MDTIATMATWETNLKNLTYEILQAWGYNAESTAVRGYYFLCRKRGTDLALVVVRVTM